MDRKKYWNDEYTRYWKLLTDEANVKDGEKSKVEKIVSGDYKTAGEQDAITFFNELTYSKKEKLLDYGCGFGRFFRYFCPKADYYGIDISESMIRECKKSFPEYENRFMVAEGEQLPFDDNFFDKVICYGVFDACYQENALKEMLRVTSCGGMIFLTGKNYLYELGDEQAYIAEEAARKKGHPNYFTNVSLMLRELNDYAEIEISHYFIRRGDMGKKIWVDEIPERFYEYILGIKKKASGAQKALWKFSDAYSDTWKEINKQ